jgi:hypothetical protein
VTARLADVAAPWYVAAGWAVDLFLGGGHRAHDDLEIAAPRERLGEILAAFPELDRFWVGDPPGLAVPFDAGQPEGSHQTWLCNPASGAWRLDVFSEPSDGDTWICRRDPSIRMPYARLIERTPDGIPYGRPEVALLFKAKAARPKDEEDFAAALPFLDADRRQWLADALTRLHPGHRWLTALRQAQPEGRRARR